jgi:RNA polymerase-binding transcription factor
MATTTNRPYGTGRARHDRLRLLLRREEATLRNRRRILRDGLPSLMSGVMDVEEQSLDDEGRRVGFSVLELTSRNVQGIEAALQRLEAGVFGTCFDCRGRISSARLRALPFAALCLACQQRQDAHGVAPTAGGPGGN